MSNIPSEQKEDILGENSSVSLYVYLPHLSLLPALLQSPPSSSSSVLRASRQFSLDIDLENVRGDTWSSSV